MFKLDTKDVRRLTRDLEKFAKKALPHASRNALNDAAFEGRRTWQGEMRRTFTTRNTWTERSVAVDKARGTNVRTMEAVLGSRADYVRTQEFGGIDDGKHVPMPPASNEAQIPRQRLVSKRHKIGAITLPSKRGKRGSKKKRNAASIRMAMSKGKKFVLLKTNKASGIFRIKGGRKNVRVRQIHLLPSRPVRIPPSPTLGPTLVKLEKKMPAIHKKALIAQLKRNKVFGY